MGARGTDAECRGGQPDHNAGDSFIHAPARPNARADVCLSAQQVFKPQSPVIVHDSAVGCDWF
jgi:hypothetical protein